jgi:hypothetical protein
MRMPPFMRHSNAQPLTLSFWQYELLMAWVKSVAVQPAPSAATAAAFANDADRRRAAVLARLAVRSGVDIA